MSHKFVTIWTLLMVFAVCANAQTPTTKGVEMNPATETTTTPTTTTTVTAATNSDCAKAIGVQMTAPLFSGVWYSIAVNPKTAFVNVSCSQTNITFQQNNSVIKADEMLSNKFNSSLMDIKYTLVAPNTLTNFQNGYDFLLMNEKGMVTQLYTVKVLSVMNNYAFVCAYSPSMSNMMSFDMLLARNRTFDATLLANLQTQAGLTGFTNANLIPQSDKCGEKAKSGAERNVPAFMTMLLFIMALYSRWN